MKTTSIRPLSTCLILKAILLLAGISHGQLINVNFHSAGGGPEVESTLDGPLGGTASTWNQSSATSGTDVLDSTNAATTIDWSITTNLSENDTFSWPDPLRRMQVGSFANFGKGEDSTLIISGLDPGEFYNLAIASTRLRTTGTEHSHGIFSTTNFTTSVSSQLANGLTSINGDAWELGVNYVLFQKVEADGSGQISVLADATDANELFAGSPAYRLHLNGFQIEKTTPPVIGVVNDAMSTVDASPATVFADGLLTSTVTVTLRDANGTGVPNKDVTLANTGGPQAAFINPFTAVTTNGAGQAVFNVSSGTPGIEIFTATDVTDSLALTDTASVEFVVVGVLTDAAQSTVVASPTARLADGLSTSTITVTLRDANGFPVSAKDVALVNSGGTQAAMISPLGTVLSDVNGQAVFSVSSITPGAEEFIATDTTDSTSLNQIAIVGFIDPNAPKLINVNFTGGQNPVTAESGLVGPAGGLLSSWNQLNTTSSGSLLDSTGEATTAAISLANLDFPALDTPVIDLTMLRGSYTNFGKGVDNTSVTISGLEAGGFYNVWLVTLRNQPFANGDPDGTEQYVGWWSTTNATTSAGNQLVDARGDVINTTTFVDGYNYVRFLNVVADGSGNIVFTGVAGPLLDGSDNNYRLGLNGLQIQEVAPVTGFNSWASANDATGQTPQQDHDNDGVRNGIEFFMGESGASFTANPSLNASNAISWPASAAYQGTYEVQTSPDLVNWTNVVPKPVPADGILSYTLPTGAPGGKSFVRLFVTPTP